jgi:hypothetical protein
MSASRDIEHSFRGLFALDVLIIWKTVGAVV